MDFSGSEKQGGIGSISSHNWQDVPLIYHLHITFQGVMIIPTTYEQNQNNPLIWWRLGNIFLKICYDCDQMSKRLSKQRFKTLPTFLNTSRNLRLFGFGHRRFPLVAPESDLKKQKTCAKSAHWFTNHSHGDFAFGTSPVFVTDKRSLTSFVRTWKNLVPLNCWKRQPLESSLEPQKILFL